MGFPSGGARCNEDVQGRRWAGRWGRRGLPRGGVGLADRGAGDFPGAASGWRTGAQGALDVAADRRPRVQGARDSFYHAGLSFLTRTFPFLLTRMLRQLNFAHAPPRRHLLRLLTVQAPPSSAYSPQRRHGTPRNAAERLGCTYTPRPGGTALPSA